MKRLIFSLAAITILWLGTVRIVGSKEKPTPSLPVLVTPASITIPALPLSTSTPNLESPTPTQPESSASAEKWIEVDLSEQTLKCWEGDKKVCSFLVSTGLSHTPTPTGSFRIYSKSRFVDMGCGSSRFNYCVPNVPFVMGLFEDYTIHGTYWHSNFGHPMSHGCINLKISDAEWIYNWTPLETRIEIVP